MNAKWLEENLVTANILIDRRLAGGMLVCLANRDISNTCQKMRWPRMWSALKAHGDLRHLVLIVPCLFLDTNWKNLSGSSNNDAFATNAGARQTLLLSPLTNHCCSAVGHA